MLNIQRPAEVSGDFASAIDSLQPFVERSSVHVDQIDSPAGLAKHAIAFSAHVLTGSEAEQSVDSGSSGTGRLVLLWDEPAQENWFGNFRVICFIKSAVEFEIASDASSSEIAWDWLTDALRSRGASYAAPAGTVTRILSVGFGALETQNHHAQVEMRASWSLKNNDFLPHFEAWLDAVALFGGQTNEHVARI